MARNNNTFTTTMVLKHTTAKAYLLDEGDGTEHWMPRSQVTVEPTGSEHDGMPMVEVTMPEWLAVKRELV